MKKTFLTVLAAVLTIVSCHKNEQNFLSPKDAILSATIEEVSATKTFMDDNNNVRWSQGDQVVAFMKTSYGHKYNLVSSFAGKTYADFKLASSGSSDNLSAGIELDHNVVYYPYSDEIEVEKSGSGYVLEVILPNEQTYAAGSFGNGSMPMVAVSENNNIIFRNICGGIKLMIKGNQKVASIRIEGKDDERLSGPAVVTAYTDDRKPAITMSSEALASVTLDCGDGIQLSENSAVAFIISLPPVCFSNGFTATVTDTEGNDYTIETDRSNTVHRSSLLVMPVIILDESGSAIPEEDPSIIHGHNPEPYFSEMVELMGLLWRMAGSNEYSQCNVGTVANSADRYFASMKNHDAVKLANQYRQRNIVYDAVTAYANQLIFDGEGKIIFDPDYLEGSNSSFDRWSYQQKNDMLAAVNDFYVASGFHDWFVTTQSEQEQSIASFKSVCSLDYTWFDSFYGKNDKVASRIILSFMIGGNNNGISLKRQDGTLLLTPVLGCLNQYNGNISFNGDMNLIVHEFSHPYCNPLIEENWSAISSKASEVFSYVSDIMASQAYGNPMTMMCETLVRSCAIRYMFSHNQKSLVSKTLSYEEKNGFMMVRSLVKVLEKREKEAAQYPTLADFMPVLIEAINNFDPDDDSNQGGSAEPDTLPHDYVDLGLEMSDGRKLYFATRNVGETSPGGIGSTLYRWGATYDAGEEWLPESANDTWPAGHKLDAEHDISTIKWGSDWHTPSVEEWNYLLSSCDYERKEADESGYDVAGYFFYNKSDRSKFIFLPVAPWDDELEYWTSEICAPDVAATFSSGNGSISTNWRAGINSSGFAVRPVIAAEDTFDANGHDYVDLGIKMNDGKTLYFATMNVGETSPAGFWTFYYCWGATEDNGEPWRAGANGWPAGTKLDAAHDIATITWGEEWHIPSVEEWTLLKDNCDYERKEADESGYGVAGYFFYNRYDRSKFIFLPVSTWNNELEYWTSEIYESKHAYTFSSYNGHLYSSNSMAPINSDGFAIRPVFVE